MLYAIGWLVVFVPLGLLGIYVAWKALPYLLVLLGVGLLALSDQSAANHGLVYPGAALGLTGFLWAVMRRA